MQEDFADHWATVCPGSIVAVVVTVMMVAAITGEPIGQETHCGSAQNGRARFHHGPGPAIGIIDRGATGSHCHHGDGEEKSMKKGFHGR
jgi:hypothetical protein